MANADLQFLRGGQQIVERYDVLVDDGEGGGAVVRVTITLTGSNDAPTLSVGTGDSDGATLQEGVDALDASGSLSAADVDVADVVTVSATLASAVQNDGTSDVASAGAQPSDEALAAMLDVAFEPVVPAGATTGTVSWTWSAGTAELGYLAAGETLTVVYDVLVSDDATPTPATSATVPVTIVITGSNVAPVITGGDVTSALTEDVAVDGSGDLTDAGTLTFGDADGSDAHTVATEFIDSTAASGTQLGTFAADATPRVAAADGATGEADWSYAVANADVQDLTANQTIVERYRVTIGDGATSAAQIVTVTITGANDAPTFSVVGTDSATATLSQGTVPATQQGTLTLTDVDLGDTVVVDATATLVSVTGSGASVGWSDVDLASMFTASGPTDATVVTAGATTGTATWTFDPGAETFRRLASGEAIDLLYRLGARDTQGVTVTQDVTITVTGANDAPTWSEGPTSTTLSESGEVLSDTGTLAAADLDRSDVVSASIAAVTVEAGSVTDGSTLDTEELRALMVATGGVADGATTGTVTWTFTASADAFAYLDAGESLVLTYVVRLDDGTATADQTVTVTLQGGNVAPIVTPGVVTGSVTEDVTDPADATVVSASGDLSFADPDAADAPTASVTNLLSITPSAGVSLPTELADALAIAAGPLTLSGPGADSDAVNAGTIDWTFTLANELLQFLAAGDAVEVAYEIEVDDGASATAQTVTITLNGVNDAPEVNGLGSTLTGTVTEGVDVVGGELTATGAVIFGDIDATDGSLATVAVSAVTPQGAAIVPTGLTDAVLNTALRLSGDGVDSRANAGTTGWTFAIADAALRELGEGETIEVVYTVLHSDEASGTATVDVTLTLTGANSPPTSTVLAPRTSDDAEVVSVDPSGGFADPDARDVLTFALSDAPAGLAIDPATGVVTGTVDGSASQGGPDSDGAYAVTITAYDRDPSDADVDDVRASTSQTFAWTIRNPAPTATPVSDTTDEDTVLSVDAAGGLLTAAHASDVDGDALRVSAVSGLAITDGGSRTVTGSELGSFVLASDGSYAVAPGSALQYLADGESVDTAVGYTITDDEGGSDTASLTVTVTGVNDAPEIALQSGDSDVATLAEDATPFRATGSLTVRDVDLSDTVGVAVTGLTTSGPLGTLDATDDLLPMLVVDADDVVLSGSVEGTATWTFEPAAATFTYLNEGDTLVLAYDVVATDDSGTASDASAVQTVTITIAGANDPADVSGDLTGGVVEAGVESDGPRGSATATGTAVASDVDSATTFEAVATLSSSTGGYGTYTVGSEGDWSYVLDDADPTVDALASGATLNDTFPIRTADGTEATVTIVITGSNDAPVTVGTIPDQDGLDASPVSFDVSTFFTDVDVPDTVSYAMAGAPGSLSIDPTTGLVSGTIDPAASQVGDGVDRGVYEVAITRTDASGLVATQTFTWTVSNRGPEPTDDLYETDEDTALSGADVLDNDAALDSDALFVELVDGAAANVGVATAGSDGGTFLIASTGELTFDPDGDFERLDVGDSVETRMVYTVSDGESGARSATVIVTVTGVDDAPVVSGTYDFGYVDTPATDAFDPITGTLEASDVDEDDLVTDLAWSFATGQDGTSPYGTLSLNADGDFAFTPDAATIDAVSAGSTPVVPFDVVVSDPQGADTPARIAFTITGANDPAVFAGDLSGSVYEDAVVQVVGGDAATSDVDGTDDAFEPVDTATVSDAGYATFTVGASGVWSYRLDGTSPDVDALDDGEELVDTFPLIAADGTETTVTIVITGGTDAAPTIDAISDDSGIDGDFVSNDPTLLFEGTGRSGLDVQIVLVDDAGEVVFDTIADRDGEGWSVDRSADDSLPDGTYVLQATTYDPAGNASDTTERTIVVDTVPPAMPTLDPVLTTDPTPILGGGYDVGDTDRIEVTVAGTTYPAELDPDGTWRIAIPAEDALASGAYDVTIIAYDLAGNGVTGPAEGTGEIVVDTRVPAVPTVDPLVSDDATPVLGGTAEVLAGDTLTIVVNGVLYDVASGAVDYDAASGRWSLVVPTEHALEEGLYDVVVTVTTAAGNATSDATEDELLVRLAAPNPPTVDQATVGTATPTVTGTAELRPGDVFTVTLDGVSLRARRRPPRSRSRDGSLDAGRSGRARPGDGQLRRRGADRRSVRRRLQRRHDARPRRDPGRPCGRRRRSRGLRSGLPGPRRGRPLRRRRPARRRGPDRARRRPDGDQRRRGSVPLRRSSHRRARRRAAARQRAGPRPDRRLRASHRRLRTARRRLRPAAR
ncbi:MAG: VCBS domain-containing protein [Trueperaceae bacterium]|nr:VCBS domain-containing protein [Trueperaceae bacterium]